MRIVNKQEFYTLPEGTLYSEYEPQIFTGLNIKHATIYSGDKPIDFFFQDLIGNIKHAGSSELMEILDVAEKGELSMPLDFDSGERDGLFNEEALYAVYENQDIEQLIYKLKQLV